MRKKSKVWLVAISLLGSSFLFCRSSLKNHPVDFVDRKVIFAVEKSSQPFLLVVEINGAGALKLNKIEMGNIENTAFLHERLKNIFADRARNSISQREIVIDRQGEIKNEDLENLIEILANAGASPIRVIKGDL